MGKHYSMKKIFSAIFLWLFIACGNSNRTRSYTQGETSKSDTNEVLETNRTSEIDSLVDSTWENNEVTYFVIVADTGVDYSILHKKMFELNGTLNIPIDTMGRYFNKTKNLIALPENDEDEIYAGEYYPRRFPSESLSLEYLNFYQKLAGEKTIALVCGIYETEKNADSALTILQKYEQKVFKVKAEIYIGCIH